MKPWILATPLWSTRGVMSTSTIAANSGPLPARSAVAVGEQRCDAAERGADHDRSLARFAAASVVGDGARIGGEIRERIVRRRTHSESPWPR